MCFIAACSQRGSTTDTYKSFSLLCKDRQLIHFRPSNKFTTDKHNVFFISCHLPSSSLASTLIWSGLTAKLIWPGLTAFSFQATVSATHPLHCHCLQERHWFWCLRLHDTVHSRKSSLAHAYGSCTLQRHSQLHSSSESSWARTLEQPGDQWSLESPGYR